MLNKQNLHIHSTYSDGKDKPEEMILTAIERGFDSIGFSEHSYMSFSDYPYQMTDEEAEDYKKEIKFLKEKYKGQIDIFCGLEFESFSVTPLKDYDYVIGSVHYMEFDGDIRGFDRELEKTRKYIDKNFASNGLEFAKKYFSRICLLPETGKFDIVGHFDLCAKNNEKGNFFDTSSKEYLNAGFEAIHALKGKIPLFEVNTGGIARGYHNNPYPKMEFLKEFKECGFGAVISSDCHDKNFIDCYYEEARELLISAGFKSRYLLTDNGFKEVEI